MPSALEEAAVLGGLYSLLVSRLHRHDEPLHARVTRAAALIETLRNERDGLRAVIVRQEAALTALARGE